MLTIRDFLIFRRRQLLEFFEWRFGVSNYVAPLAYCTGLSAATIFTFRKRAVRFATLQRIEDAALQLGFKPLRIGDRSGRFTPPRSLKLPRWSDAACRVRFYQWRIQTNGGQWQNQLHADVVKLSEKLRRQKLPRSRVKVGKFCPVKDLPSDQCSTACSTALVGNTSQPIVTAIPTVS